MVTAKSRVQQAKASYSRGHDGRESSEAATATAGTIEKHTRDSGGAGVMTSRASAAAQA